MSINKTIQPENFPEKVVWYGIIWTYIFFLLGATYIVGSVLCWILFFYLLLKLWLQTEETPEAEKISVPLIIWIWAIGMLVMEVALIMGHLDYNLPTSQIIKSSIGWAKGWAAMALYPMAGCLKIRPQIIYRAVCIVCLQTLLLSPLLIIAPILNLPEILYISPLKVVGGPGTSFFDVSLYEIDYDGQIRQRLFTPWGPALGFLGNVYFALALKEKNKKWRWFGIIGSIYVSLICKSRLAQVSLILTPTFIFFLSRLTRPFILMFLGACSVASGLLAVPILDAIDAFWTKFKAARADSSRVRRVLKEIAGYRWETEAPIWGHGVIERGPHLVEYMPIGSHHTWYGLLFIKGIVGFYALLVPMILSFLVLLVKAQKYQVARAGLAILFILFLYTFGENLEILVYLYWPGSIVMGIGLTYSEEESKSKKISL
ncbi:MAG: O-antigen ligase domain-containing protein [Prochloraceae cyanobacterium]